MEAATPAISKEPEKIQFESEKIVNFIYKYNKKIYYN